MDCLLIDHFYLKAPRFSDVCDCSLDKSVVDEAVRHFNEHNHYENVFRLLHHIGYLAPDSKYTIRFNLVQNTVFFELNLTKMFKEHPELKDGLKNLFKGEELEYWERLIRIVEKE